MLGQKGRCAQCGTKFVVPEASPAFSPPQKPQKPERDESTEPEPEYSGFECRVCQTRMYARVKDVGKKMKCPDCGGLTVIPPPPPPKKKNIPAALEGEQYEIWGANEAPLPSALADQQPKYIAVTCRKCATLMYAGESQVGQSIKCPDCGTRHVVPQPPKPKPKVSVLASDSLTPQIDVSADPGERPAVVISPRARMDFEVQQDAAYEAAREKSLRTGRPMEIDARGRPIMPRQPLLTGVWRMILTKEVIARWIVMSVVLGFAGQFLGESLLTPMQGMAEAIKLICTVIGGGLLILWLLMIGPFIVAMVGESADGHGKLLQPPRLIGFDCLGETFSVVMAASLAGICGLGAWHLARLALLGPVPSAAIVIVVVVTIFPMTLLGALLEGTPLAIVSPKLLRSLPRCAGAWLLFYIQTFVLAAVAGVAAWGLTYVVELNAREVVTTFLWCMAPIAIAALLIDMRLLGRLAWWISERMPENERGGEP